ncbi:MAG: preprotein translocase subunit YajC [Myxococcota bacterium]
MFASGSSKSQASSSRSWMLTTAGPIQWRCQRRVNKRPGLGWGLDALGVVLQFDRIAQPRGHPVGGIEQFIPLLLVIGLMYLLIIRPQNQERAAHEALLASLTKDDQVVTTGGIFGKVLSVSTETVVLEIAEKTRITLEKKFVARRIEPGVAK